jgi:hypothetical protein
MRSIGEARRALAAWLAARGSVPFADWHRAVAAVFERSMEPLAVLRLFEVGGFVDRAGNGTDSSVVARRSTMIRSIAFPNLAFLVGPHACLSPESLGATMARAGIRLEEGPASLGDVSRPNPPATSLAFPAPRGVDDGTRALGLELVEPEVPALTVDDFGSSLAPADEAYLRHGGSELWSEKDARWRASSESIDGNPVRVGVYRAQVNSSSGFRSYLRWTSENAVLWAIWHSASCGHTVSPPLLTITDGQGAWVGMSTRVPLPIELARTAFASAGAFPETSRAEAIPQQPEEWTAVSAVAAVRIARALGIDGPAEATHPGWPGGAKPPEHLTFKARVAHEPRGAVDG